MVMFVICSENTRLGIKVMRNGNCPHNREYWMYLLFVFDVIPMHIRYPHIINPILNKHSFNTCTWFLIEERIPSFKSYIHLAIVEAAYPWKGLVWRIVLKRPDLTKGGVGFALHYTLSIDYSHVKTVLTCPRLPVSTFDIWGGEGIATYRYRSPYLEKGGQGINSWGDKW